MSERVSASVVLIIRCESGKQFFFLLEYEVCPSPPPQLPILLEPFHGPAHVGMRRGDQEANELVQEGAKSFVLSLFTAAAAAAVTFQCVPLLLFFLSQVPGLFTRSKTKHVKEEREKEERGGKKTVCPALNDLKKD